MSRKVYLSFLGTNDYIPCNYTSDHASETIEGIRFVQEATISWHCRDWSGNDRILILTTAEACQKNWYDNGHESRPDEPGREGLESRLQAMDPPLAAEIRKIDIPSGRSEAEIWQIFSKIIDELNDGDQLYLDITHALRSLPLLAMVVLNYAKTLKNIKVLAIDYGAMEALGPVNEVKKMALEKRTVPVFDLLAFDELLDWTQAIDRFTTSGDAQRMVEMTRKRARKQKLQIMRSDWQADGLSKLADALSAFTGSMTTCRAKEISQHARDLKQRVAAVSGQELIKQLTPLLTKMEETLSEFTGDDIDDGVAACRWCLRHNLVQQGFTLLEETMITHVLQQSGLENNGQDERALVPKAISIKGNKHQDSPKDWDAAAVEHKEQIQKILTWLDDNPQYHEYMRNLIKYRNDLNHAGMRDSPMGAKKFTEKLEELVNFFADEIRKNTP